MFDMHGKRLGALAEVGPERGKSLLLVKLNRQALGDPLSPLQLTEGFRKPGVVNTPLLRSGRHRIHAQSKHRYALFHLVTITYE
jgi:hypothetical protein